MRKTEYLYGIKPEELEGMEYFKALGFKYEAARKLYKELYLIKNKTEEEEVRLFYVEKAMLHTKKLIDEAGESGVYKYTAVEKPKLTWIDRLKRFFS